MSLDAEVLDNFVQGIESFMPYVAGFMFTPDLEAVVLVKKTHPEWQKGRLNAVGGKIEDYESVPDAMAREFGEETGVITWPSEWFRFAELLDPKGSHVIFFVCKSEKALFAKTTTNEEIWLVERTSVRAMFPVTKIAVVDKNGEVTYKKENTHVHAVYNLPWLCAMAVEALEERTKYFVAEQRERV